MMNFTLLTCVLESAQDFLIELGIKPLMHLLEISTFSLNNGIIRLTKIINRADKNWAHFKKIKYLKNQNIQKIFLIKVGLLVQYSSQNFSFGKIQPIFKTEKLVESQNFEMFKEFW